MRENGEICIMRKYPSPNANVRLDEITYWSDGLRVKGMLARPIAQGDYDALLYLRGGLQSIGMVRPARIAQFAAQGFVVFAPYYRGNRGGEGKDEFAGADRYDAVYGADVLKQFVQRDMVHVYGFSRGGLMALFTAIIRNDIASVVIWAGVSDAVLTYEDRIDMRRGLKRIIGGTPNKVPDAYRARTPLYALEKINAPVFIIHGLQDRHVNIEHAYRLEAGLKALNKRYETSYADGEKHHYMPKVNMDMVRHICHWMRAQ